LLSFYVAPLRLSNARLTKIKKAKDEHPHKIERSASQAGDFDDLVVPLLLVKKPRRSTSKSPRQTFRAMAIRKITPIVTWCRGSQ